MSFVNTQQAYGRAVGSFATSSIWVDTRDPTPRDVNFQIGQFWNNKTTTSIWFLNNFVTQNGVVSADWIIINGVSSLLESISDSNNDPVYATGMSASVPNNIQLFSSSGSISVTADAPNNRLSIDVASVSLTWSVITTSPATTKDKGYFINGGALINVPLPQFSDIGDTIEVCAMTTFGWRITQQGTQIMRIGTSQTSTGLIGNISSLNVGDWVELVCNVPSSGGYDNEWMVNVKQGNITVV